MSISRTDAYGLLVRVKRNGKLFSKYFSFSAHGGKRATMRTAKSYSAKLQAIPRVAAVGATAGNRTTRIRGISLSTYRNRAKGTKVHEYKVNYTSPDTGERRVKSFYVGIAHTFTKARAAAVLKQAIRFRSAWEREQRKASRAAAARNARSRSRR